MTSGHATHFLPNDKGDSFWTCGGRYDYGLVRTPRGWRVRQMKFTMTWARGNPQLLQMAAKK